jgi:hypothetical protein
LGWEDSTHAEEIGIQFSLGNAAIVVPEMKNLEACKNIAKAKGVVVESMDVGGRDS